MVDVGLQMFCMCTVLSIVRVKPDAVLQFGCSASFEQNVTYNGVVPDDYIYMDSITGISRIQCCLDCHDRRPHCVGVLYNNEGRKCKLLKRNPNEINQPDNLTSDDWQYFQKVHSSGGLYVEITTKHTLNKKNNFAQEFCNYLQLMPYFTPRIYVN
jgi:hypothetical protein